MLFIAYHIIKDSMNNTSMRLFFLIPSIFCIQTLFSANGSTRLAPVPATFCINRTIHKQLASSPDFQAYAAANLNQQQYNDFKGAPGPDNKTILRLKTNNPYDPLWMSIHKQAQDLQKQAPKQPLPTLSRAALNQLKAKIKEAEQILAARDAQRTPSPVAQGRATPIEIDESKVAVKKPSPKRYIALPDRALEDERIARENQQQQAWKDLIKKVDAAIKEDKKPALSEDEEYKLRKNKGKLNREQRTFLHPILKRFKLRI